MPEWQRERICPESQRSVSENRPPVVPEDTVLRAGSLGKRRWKELKKSLKRLRLKREKGINTRKDKQEMIKRPRRLRDSEILRKMVRETRVDKASLIYPVFIKEGKGIIEEIPSMPGQYRYSVDRLPFELEKVRKAGVSSVMFFGIPEEKDEYGSQATRRMGSSRRPCGRRRSSFRICIISQTYACVSTPPMDIAGCFVATRSIMTLPSVFWRKRPFPRCRRARIWWRPPI